MNQENYQWWQQKAQAFAQSHLIRSDSPTVMQAGNTDVRNAYNMDGFTVNQEFQEVVLDYKRKNTIFWKLIKKEFATMDKIQHVEDDLRPSFGFVNKRKLNEGWQTNKPEDTELNLFSNEPQEIKAIAGEQEWPYYQQSLSAAQGHPWGDKIDKDTDKLFNQGYYALERALFIGNSSLDPLQFNGIERQMDHFNGIYDSYIDLSDPNPDNWDSIANEINRIVVKATSDPDIVRNISHVWGTPDAYILLQEEVKRDSLKYNQLEIIPNNVVKNVMTADKEGSEMKPVRFSPYLFNVRNWKDPKTENFYDLLRFYLIDMACLRWFTLPQWGAARSHEYQIHDTSTYGNHSPLLTKRAMLLFGTPMVYNHSVWRINLKVPTGKYPDLNTKAAWSM